MNRFSGSIAGVLGALFLVACGSQSPSDTVMDTTGDATSTVTNSVSSSNPTGLPPTIPSTSDPAGTGTGAVNPTATVPGATVSEPIPTASNTGTATVPPVDTSTATETAATTTATTDSATTAATDSTTTAATDSTTTVGTDSTTDTGVVGTTESTTTDTGVTSEPPPPPPPAPEVITSADQAPWVTTTYTPGATGNADVTVSDTGSQTWSGFGGSFNEAGWDALSVLSETDRQLALTLLYDAADGANFTFGRLPIGASDYALSAYSLAETPNDTTMSSFSIARDQQNLIPFVKAAMAVKPDIHFWASPWTPPAWMKTNNSLNAVAGKNPPYADADGVMKGDDATLNAFALYLEKYVQEYANVGIPISAIHPQNEPGYGNPYPSCYWPSDLYIKFIRDYLGPKFKADLPNVEIWAGTMSAPGDGDIAVTLSRDATALSFVTGFGLQWNTKDKVATLRATNRLVMQTEHKCGNYDFATDYWDRNRYDANKPQNDYAYAVESWKNIRDWVKAGVNSYSAWNMVLDTSGANLNTSKPWHQNALLVVDRAAKQLIQTPAYYVFRHLSQYAEPGSTVVGTTGGDALAFKKDNHYVVVMYNEGAAKQAIVAVGGEKLQFAMPANGWATINYTK